MQILRLCLLFFIVFSFELQAQESLCDILNLPNCSGVNKITRRSSAKSLPSSGSSTQFNPATVSHDRGFGVESFIQSGNPMNYSLVTGTGRMGAAFISSGNENGFFGNRLIENGDEYLNRRLEKKQYQSQKYNGAFGVGLLKNNRVNLDLGVSAKYNKNIRQLNPGAGVSLRWGPVSMGVSQYKDDVFIPTDSFGLGQNYQESFSVQTFFAGVKIKNLFLDAGTISTKFDGFDETFHIRIYSAAFIFRNFLFNVAQRQEETGLQKFKEGALVTQRSQSSTYFGLQYSAHKLLVLGVHYNYHLLDEVSGSVAIFF